MKRIIVYIGLIICIVFINSNVYAITNKNGIEINDDIYSKLIKFYGEDYLMTISKNDYEDLIMTDINSIKMVSLNDLDSYNVLSNTETTNYKNLKIITSGSKVTVKLDWLKQPKVRNYDVMAIRFLNVKSNGIIGAKYIYGNYSYKQLNEFKYLDNGLGFSFKLPTEDIKSVIFEFKATGNGSIYATYQHSTTNKINYTQSRNFYISSSGLGGVLSFKNGIDKYYDNMNGVSIAI